MLGILLREKNSWILLVLTTLTLCITEEENLLNKDDFDMDWKTVEEHLITSSKIVDDEEVIFDEDDEIIIPPNQIQWEWTNIFKELENVNKWFDYLMY